MIFLQVFVFLVVLAWRGRFMFGYQLGKVKDHPGWLMYIRYPSRINSSARHVGVVRNGGIPFIIRPERWYHRSFKRVGLASEVALPDAAFDRKYFVTTDFPHSLERLMEVGNMMDHLNALTAMGVSEIYATPTKVWCELDVPKLSLKVEAFTAYFDLLNGIAAGTVAANGGPVADFIRHRARLALVFLAVHAALLVSGLMWVIAVHDSPMDIIDNDKLGWYGAAAGVTALAGWGAAIVMVFKRTSWFGWVMVDYWIWGVAGILLSCSMWVREADITMAQPEVVMHDQTVKGKTCTLHCCIKCGQGKNSQHHRYNFNGEVACKPLARMQTREAYATSVDICREKAWFDNFHVAAASWRNQPDEVYNLQVNKNVFDAVHMGEKIVVPVHSGSLGMEWVDRREARP